MAQVPNASIVRRPRLLFWRLLLLRSLSVKRPQAALAMGSMVVGAAVISMLVNLYGDARRKMTQEFRAYGANVLLTPASTDLFNPDGSGGVMPEEVLSRLGRIQERSPGLAVAPMLYVVARLARVPSEPSPREFQNAVAVGTDFPALRRLFPTWQVEGADGALDPGSCAVGAQLASRLHLDVGDRLQLETDRQSPKLHELLISGLVATGASEDSQVFISLRSLQRLAGMEGKISLIQLGVPGGKAEVERVAGDLAQAFPDLEVRPIRQIIYSEEQTLGTIRALMMSQATSILVIVALCVAATMTAIVLERRRDIALMKGLGASDRAVSELFLGEAAGLGLAGGTVGFILGGLVAQRLAVRLFGVTLSVVWWTFPLVCLSTVFVALAATIFPIRIVRGVQPAVVLKGE